MGAAEQTTSLQEGFGLDGKRGSVFGSGTVKWYSFQHASEGSTLLITGSRKLCSFVTLLQ